VKCRFEVLNAAGLVETAVSGGNTYKINEDPGFFDKDNGTANRSWGVTAINSTEQPTEEANIEDHRMDIRVGDQKTRFFLSMCPNGSSSSSWTARKYHKLISLTDQAENLYFYLDSIQTSSSLTTWAGVYPYQSRFFKYYFKVEAWNGTTTNIKFLDTEHDCFWNSTAFWWDYATYAYPGGTFLSSPPYPRIYLAQNVSPAYINNNSGSGVATPIDEDTIYYL
jgi:hypothetical protein